MDIKPKIYRMNPAQKQQIEEAVKKILFSKDEVRYAFLFHVVRGKLIIDKDEEARCDFMERVVRRCLDMKPLLHRAIGLRMMRRIVRIS
ncbi:MAG: hypothetical protein KAW12_21775 [Candidatus Aminicenantes bacterium]|nr:hypothetical protein [Candidatus Aminicenantes bacterium]